MELKNVTLEMCIKLQFSLLLATRCARWYERYFETKTV